MKTITLITIASLLLTGCSKNESRYEMLRIENGAIRIDNKTGEMVLVKNDGSPLKVNTDVIKEESEFDADLAEVKQFDEYRLPNAKKGIKLLIQYRWMNGRMDYRLNVSPYSEELNASLRQEGTRITIIFLDKDLFEIKKFDAPLANLIKLVDKTGVPTKWEAENFIPMTKAEFKRINDVTYSWYYSEDLKKFLNQ